MGQVESEGQKSLQPYYQAGESPAVPAKMAPGAMWQNYRERMGITTTSDTPLRLAKEFLSGEYAQFIDELTLLGFRATIERNISGEEVPGRVLDYLVNIMGAQNQEDLNTERERKLYTQLTWFITYAADLQPNSYQDTTNVEPAVDLFKKALAISPQFADALLHAIQRGKKGSASGQIRMPTSVDMALARELLAVAPSGSEERKLAEKIVEAGEHAVIWDEKTRRSTPVTFEPYTPRTARIHPYLISRAEKFSEDPQTIFEEITHIYDLNIKEILRSDPSERALASIPHMQEDTAIALAQAVSGLSGEYNDWKLKATDYIFDVWMQYNVDQTLIVGLVVDIVKGMIHTGDMDLAWQTMNKMNARRHEQSKHGGFGPLETGITALFTEIIKNGILNKDTLQEISKLLPTSSESRLQLSSGDARVVDADQS